MKRSEVPEKETWDLGLIYESDDDAWRDADEVKRIAARLEQEYKGKLKDADTIVDCLRLYEHMLELADRAAIYFSLKVETDYSNAGNLADQNKVESMLTDCMADTTFIESEILSQDESVLREAMEKGGQASDDNEAAKGAAAADGPDTSKGAAAADDPAAKVGPVSDYLRRMLRRKPHTLSAETEKVLASLGEFMESPYQVYNQAKLSDMRFSDFTVNGREYPLTYSLFEDNYEYEKDTDVRRAAFRHFSDKLSQYQNVTAAAYNAYVTRDKRISDARGFSSVFDYLLFEEEVPRELYDRQIDVIMDKLAPHMRKYAKLIQKLYGLDRMTYADLKLPVDPDLGPEVTIEQTEKYVADGLSVLGDDYVDMVHRAFRERWFDYCSNDGKCTGGFCESPYGVPASFILLSFQGRMSDVFTVAHELGHAGHFMYCNDAQGFFDVQVPMYYVESPSTMNELLLTGYMKRTSSDPRFRRWVLANTVSNTYYHNFVTHLLEAAYQREVYKIVDEGGSVQADTLSGIYRDVLTRFWGDAVELTDGAELTWMRQPHYYMGLYSYTYSASLTISTQVARRIATEEEKRQSGGALAGIKTSGAPDGLGELDKDGCSELDKDGLSERGKDGLGELDAVSDWKKAMKAGSTVSPVGFAKMAGVDISTDKPLLDTIEYIGQMIDEICALSE